MSLEAAHRRLTARQASGAKPEDPRVVVNPKFDDDGASTTTKVQEPSETTIIITEPTTLVITPSIVTQTVTSTADLPEPTSTTSSYLLSSSANLPTSSEDTNTSSTTMSQSTTPGPSSSAQSSSTLTSDEPSASASHSANSTASITSSSSEASSAPSASDFSSQTSNVESSTATSTADSTTNTATEPATSSMAVETSSLTTASTALATSTPTHTDMGSTTSISVLPSTASTDQLSSTSASSTGLISESSSPTLAPASTSESSTEISTSNTQVSTPISTLLSTQTAMASSSAVSIAPVTSAIVTTESASRPSAVSSASAQVASSQIENSSRSTITFNPPPPTTTYMSISTTLSVFSSPSTQVKPVTTTLDPIESSSLAIISSILSSVSRQSVLSVSSVRSASEASIRSSLAAASSHFDDAPTLPPTTVEALPSASITATITKSRGSTADIGDGKAGGGTGSGTSAGESSAEHFFSTIGKSPGSIVLVVLVCVGFAALAVLIGWLLIRCRRRRRDARGVRIGSDHGSPFWGHEGKDPEKGQAFGAPHYGATKSLLDDDDEDDRVEPEDVWRRRVGRIASASEQGTDASSWTSMIGDHEFPTSESGAGAANNRVSDMTLSSTGTSAQTFGYGTLGLAPPPALRPHPLRNSFVPTFSPSLYSRDGDSHLTGEGSSPTSPPAPLLSYTLPSPPRTPTAGAFKEPPMTPQTTVSSPRSPLSSGSPRTPLLQRSPDSSKSLRESLSQVMGAAAEYIGNMLHADNQTEADRYTYFSSPRKAPPTPVIIPPSPSRDDRDDIEWQGARTALMQAEASDDLDENPASPSFLDFVEAQRARGAVGTVQTVPLSQLLSVPPSQDTARDRAVVAAHTGGTDLLQLNEQALDPFSDAAAESLAALQNPFSDAARVEEPQIRRRETPPPVYRQPLLSFLSPFNQKVGSSGEETLSDSSSSTAKPLGSDMTRHDSLKIEGALRRGSSGSLKSSLFSAAGALLGRRGSASTILGSDRRGSGATITPSRLRYGSNATVTAASSAAALMRRASLPASNSSSSGSSENVPAPVRRPTFVSQASWSSSSGDHADLDLSPTQQPRARMPAGASPSLYPSTIDVDNILTTSPALSDAPTIDSIQFALPKHGQLRPVPPARRRTTSNSTFGTTQTSGESPIMAQRLASELVTTMGVERPSGVLTLPTPLLFGSPSPSYISTSSNATSGSDSSRARVEQGRKMSLKVETTKASELLLERRRKSEGALPFATSNEGVKGLFGVGSHIQ
ncbi:hypothetical protein OIV83_001658 [Microbotryomycetes sp. JL201]|nr:hypothetical protein OIV83_001658 [Microbotryomycetes sp. JL201]